MGSPARRRRRATAAPRASCPPACCRRPASRWWARPRCSSSTRRRRRGAGTGPAGPAWSRSPDRSSVTRPSCSSSGAVPPATASSRPRPAPTGSCYRIPVTPGPGTDRGALAGAMRWVVQKVVVPLAGDIVGAAGEHVVARWERARRPPAMRFYTPRLYQTPKSEPVDPGDLDGRRVLVLLHGLNAQSHDRNGLGAMPLELVEELNRCLRPRPGVRPSDAGDVPGRQRRRPSRRGCRRRASARSTSSAIREAGSWPAACSSARAPIWASPSGRSCSSPRPTGARRWPRPSTSAAWPIGCSPSRWSCRTTR